MPCCLFLRGDHLDQSRGLLQSPGQFESLSIISFLSILYIIVYTGEGQRGGNMICLKMYLDEEGGSLKCTEHVRYSSHVNSGSSYSL